MQLVKPEKEEQTNSKERKRAKTIKIREEVAEIGNRNTTEKNSEISWFFEQVKLTKFLLD